MTSLEITSENSTNAAAFSITQTMGAIAFGIIILFAVGFAPMDAAHNAAHDTRHTFAFPCH